MGVVVIHSTPALTKIGDIQDTLANVLAVSLGSWSLELKLYRANPASFAQTDQARAVTYTVTSSDAPKIVCLYTGQDGQEGLMADEELAPILNSKLQSLWIARQTFKGDGVSLKLDGRTIRLANIFVQGNYKGLIVQIESEGTPEEVLAWTRELVSKHDIPGQVPDLVVESRLDIGRQYQQFNR